LTKHPERHRRSRTRVTHWYAQSTYTANLSKNSPSIDISGLPVERIDR